MQTIETGNPEVPKIDLGSLLMTNAQVNDYVGDVYDAAKANERSKTPMTPFQSFVLTMANTLGMAEVIQFTADVSVAVELGYTIATSFELNGEVYTDSIYDFIPQFLDLALEQDCFEIGSLFVAVGIDHDKTVWEIVREIMKTYTEGEDYQHD